VDEYNSKYKNTLQKITDFISYIDFVSCMAKVSHDNVFIKPIIDEDVDYSYMTADDLIHPIIAKINNNVKYIGNDISIGKDQKGILLYGVNAVGKSSLMKSVGISVILAQTGFFVPAKNFKYSPYKYLFTRISNNDNMRKGQSTFEVEMSELRSILIRTNKNSLVLGDELCSGTETISGVSIVASGVLRLVSRESSFIFATHLHQLSGMSEINNCEGVNSYHMETIFDNITKKLIYDRKLKKGSGSSIYGLEVAKAMDLDKDFIELAYNIRNKLLDKNSKIVENKTSHFNSDIVIGRCSICKEKTEEVHHISEQHIANSDGIIDNFHKNDLFNLVQLCSKCHNKVHYENLKITGYVSTSDGIELQYKLLEPNDSNILSSKKKFNNDQIDIIRDIYKNTNNFNRTKKTLQLQGISISNNTIKKIVEYKY
jgi:DNA mismatch repair protein MutS